MKHLFCYFFGHKYETKMENYVIMRVCSVCGK